MEIRMELNRLRPKQIDIEVTNKCNLSCKYCPNVCNKTFPEGNMSFDFFKSIVDRIDFPTTVVAWLNGEPFMNPEYNKMVAYLNEKKQRFYVTTNLTIWRQDVLEELLKKGSSCYQIIISMDGMWGTGNIAKARPGTNEMVLKYNLERLFKMKRELQSETDIAVKICERGQDWGEIEKYVQYWLSTGDVDFVVVGKPLKDTNTECMRTEKCQYSDNNFMVIRWDGSLVVCAYNDKAANGLELSYGKLDMTTPLLDAFNNEKAQAFRAAQRNGIYPEPCAHCGFAYTGVGYHGQVSFRGKPDVVYYTQSDYYNTFFSRVQRWKNDSYYTEE